jgi:hypothetical protein
MQFDHWISYGEVADTSPYDKIQKDYHHGGLLASEDINDRSGAPERWVSTPSPAKT